MSGAGGEALTRTAPAKLNLFLRVLAREADGQHSLETLFTRLELADIITACRAEGDAVTLRVSGAETGPVEQNLAYRAAESVLAALRSRFAVALELDKRIPAGAGLGGGSADAAATLILVNQLAGNAVPRAELLQMAARLGADVPYCLSEADLALAWGRGDRMMTLPGLPAAPVLLVIPPVSIRTGEAYRWLDDARVGSFRRGGLLLEPDSLRGWGDVARMAGNDFESVIFARVAAVREAFEALVRTGPLLCRMTGSGSALFAVYRREQDRDDARMVLGGKQGTVLATRTLGP